MKIGGIPRRAGGRWRRWNRHDLSVLAALAPGRTTSYMSAEGTREFVDANVLVYALDASAGAKGETARELVERLWHSGNGCLSVQVLQEFFVTVTRKVARPLSVDAAENRVREFAVWNVFAPTAEDVLAASALHKKAKLSFWDAMIVEAAAQSACEILWTEDLSDGQLLRGVRVRNPFSGRRVAQRVRGKRAGLGSEQRDSVRWFDAPARGSGFGACP